MSRHTSQNKIRRGATRSAKPNTNTQVNRSTHEQLGHQDWYMFWSQACPVHAQLEHAYWCQ